ncbi:MAG: serpin family protein [Planctomycetota bacterium]
MRPSRRPFLFLTLFTAAAATVVATARNGSPGRGPGPEPLGAAGAACADALARFTTDLYLGVAEAASGENVVASPWSAWSALASFATFCEGPTRHEIVRALGFESGEIADETLRAGRAELLERMARADRHVTLDASQAAWIERSLPLQDGASAALRRSADVDLRRVDFRRGGEGAGEKIAAWIRRATGGGARRSAVTYPPETDLVLTDALFLHAHWLEPFQENKTWDGPFQLLDGTEIRVPTMVHEFSHGTTGKKDPEFRAVRLFEDDEGAAATAVELPHRGQRTSLVVIVPDRMDGVFDVERKLDVAALGAALDAETPRTIKVSLPRFSLRRDVDMEPVLRSLGIEAAFEGADLSRLFDDAEGDRTVGRVAHGAALDVDEHGVRAWAWTEWSVFAALPHSIEADRPFLVLVRERTSGAVLFLGRVLDPRS